MAKGKKPPASPSDPVAAMLEELRSQKALIEHMRSENRLTAETVGAKVDFLAQQIEDARRESQDRDALLEAAIRATSTRLEAAIRETETRLEAAIRDTETKLEAAIRDTNIKLEGATTRLEGAIQDTNTKVDSLAQKIDVLLTLEPRVSALERRRA